MRNYLRNDHQNISCFDDHNIKIQCMFKNLLQKKIADKNWWDWKRINKFTQWDAVLFPLPSYQTGQDNLSADLCQEKHFVFRGLRRFLREIIRQRIIWLIMCSMQSLSNTSPDSSWFAYVAQRQTRLLQCTLAMPLHIPCDALLEGSPTEIF